MKPKEYSLITMARIDYPLSPERIMSELVPWFTTWGFDLDTSKSISDTISLFMESRESPRWGLLGNGVVASERHAWSAWTILRRLELHGKCVAKSPDTEFLRIVAGTRQIKEGIRRSGLSQDDKIGWVFYLPEHRGRNATWIREDSAILLQHTQQQCDEDYLITKWSPCRQAPRAN